MFLVICAPSTLESPSFSFSTSKSSPCPSLFAVVTCTISACIVTWCSMFFLIVFFVSGAIAHQHQHSLCVWLRDFIVIHCFFCSKHRRLHGCYCCCRRC